MNLYELSIISAGRIAAGQTQETSVALIQAEAPPTITHTADRIIVAYVAPEGPCTQVFLGRAIDALSVRQLPPLVASATT